MARRETAKKASHMQGDKLYQKCARAVLPVLVRQAKARKSITYGSLAKELGMPNPRNLNYPLGSVGTTLQRLGKKWKQRIPQIQTLVVNKNTRLPGSGIDGFLKGFAGLPPKQQRERVKATHSKVYDYRQWDDVLRALKLKNAKPLVTNEEIFSFLAIVSYDRDRRSPPDPRRYGQFVVGWEDAAVRRQSQGYTERTLRSLTWRNLGFRFGQHFGYRTEEEIRLIWAVLASHYKRTRGTEATDLAEEIDAPALVEGVKTGISFLALRLVSINPLAFN